MSNDPATAQPRRAPTGLDDRARDTKERLLDAAEQIFAERGFDGASMRAVTQAAGASVSAANYHFGSKEELLRATFRRRVEPVNRRRLERLDALERQARDAGRPVAVEGIVEAFLWPVVEEHAGLESREAWVRQLAARLYADPPEIVDAIKAELFGELSLRFTAALAQALPEQSPEEIARGFHFLVGIMVHVLSGNLDASPPLFGPLTDSPEQALRHVARFASAGLRAGLPLESSDADPGATS